MVAVRRRKPSITTVHLGQFTRETANAIAGCLEKAGIVWWYKEPGYLSQVWEFGVRLFVDRDRLQEAEQIAERVTASRERRRREREEAERVTASREPRRREREEAERTEASAGPLPQGSPEGSGECPAQPPDERR
jgi:hypothetical protein